MWCLSPIWADLKPCLKKMKNTVEKDWIWCANFKKLFNQRLSWGFGVFCNYPSACSFSFTMHVMFLYHTKPSIYCMCPHVYARDPEDERPAKLHLQRLPTESIVILEDTFSKPIYAPFLLFFPFFLFSDCWWRFNFLDRPIIQLVFRFLKYTFWQVSRVLDLCRFYTKTPAVSH